MDEKQPLMSPTDDDVIVDEKKMPIDPPPSYNAAARESGVPLRPSGSIRRGPGGKMPIPMPLPPGPPQPFELPIIQYMRTHRVILASASPRRRAMLAQLGLGNVEVRPSTMPENLSKAELGPHGYVAATARQKALDVYQDAIREMEEAEEAKDKADDDDNDDNEDAANGQEEENGVHSGDDSDGAEEKRKRKSKIGSGSGSRKRPHPGGDPALVISADTVIVTRDGQVLEKPSSEAAHGRMLRHLRDTRVHKVLTAVCAVAPRADAQHPGYEMRTHVEETRVYFARAADGLPDDVVDAYVRSREGADKAGGYAIQGLGGMVLVERVEGPVDNVVGLPVRRCLQLCEKVVFKQGHDSDEESDDDDDAW